jgi:molecular chaperone DnaJ
LRVKADPRFERDGENLYSELEIGYLQAILGDEVEVETLRGKKPLHIPKAAQYGQQVRLANEGLPSLRGARVGDTVYVLKIVMPKKLSKDEEKLLKQIAESKAGSKDKAGFFGF